MSKFLNKKEQVFDIKLTSYGHYLLSVGKFKPAYYAFYDDNILYDKKYADVNSNENQNDIENRIQKDTQYIEGLVLFRDVEETLNNGEGATDWYNQLVISPRQQVPTADVFRLDNQIGDVFSEGDANLAPAWKVVSLQSVISSVDQTDASNNSTIPQINVTSIYRKKAVDLQEFVTSLETPEDDIRSQLISTLTFEDGKTIQLVNNDPLCYVEELNTTLLNSNFDIEVFHVLTSSNDGNYDQLERKYFRTQIPQIQNGFMVSETPERVPEGDITNTSVEYYFDVLVDQQVDKFTACKAAAFFNKKSYYVDLDFDCDEVRQEREYYDIYGTVTEPEICLD
jgi:hypothetical protein